jgi:hypothetical protein
VTPHFIGFSFTDRRSSPIKNPAGTRKGDIDSEFVSGKGAFGRDQTADSIRPAAYAKDGGGQIERALFGIVNKEAFKFVCFWAAL